MVTDNIESPSVVLILDNNAWPWQPTGNRLIIEHCDLDTAVKVGWPHPPGGWKRCGPDIESPQSLWTTPGLPSHSLCIPRPKVIRSRIRWTALPAATTVLCRDLLSAYQAACPGSTQLSWFAQYRWNPGQAPRGLVLPSSHARPLSLDDALGHPTAVLAAAWSELDETSAAEFWRVWVTRGQPSIGVWTGSLPGEDHNASELAGWALHYPNGELGAVHVRETHRRKGYGTALMNAMTKAAGAHQVCVARESTLFNSKFLDRDRRSSHPSCTYARTWLDYFCRVSRIRLAWPRDLVPTPSAPRFQRCLPRGGDIGAISPVGGI